jgi:hypothetical protein
VFETRLTKKLLEFLTEGVAGAWRKQHNEKLHDLCSSPNDIRVTRSWRSMRGPTWGRTVSGKPNERYGFEGKYNVVLVHAMKVCRESRSISPLIHKLSSRRRWSIS